MLAGGRRMLQDALSGFEFALHVGPYEAYRARRTEHELYIAAG